MRSGLYSNSIQLDSMISEKLNDISSIQDLSSMSSNQLKSEINALRYLLYLANQDRLVRLNQALRNRLLNSISMTNSISEKESIQKSASKEFDYSNYQLALYENTGNASDIHTVVNTSLFPYSCENTEREFSPFSGSPAVSPRGVAESVPTAVLTTEISKVKAKGVENSLPLKYLRQLQGDDDEIPWGFTDMHSRDDSVNF